MFLSSDLLRVYNPSKTSLNMRFDEVFILNSNIGLQKLNREL